MSTRVATVFILTFVVVYLAISLIDTGSVYWLGLIGSVIGALLAIVMVNYVRRDGSTNPNH